MQQFVHGPIPWQFEHRVKIRSDSLLHLYVIKKHAAHDYRRHTGRILFSHRYCEQINWVQFDQTNLFLPIYLVVIS